jgi:hypothetical protein
MDPGHRVFYGKFRSHVLILLLIIGVLVLAFSAVYGFSCQGVICCSSIFSPAYISVFLVVSFLLAFPPVSCVHYSSPHSEKAIYVLKLW